MVAASNVVPPLYHLILEKGYKIQIINESIIATKNGFSVESNNFFELAGLVFLIENKGKDWRVSDELIDEFITFYRENK